MNNSSILDSKSLRQQLVDSLLKDYPAFIATLNSVLKSHYKDGYVIIEEESFQNLLNTNIKEYHPDLDTTKVTKYDHKHLNDFREYLQLNGWLLNIEYNYKCFYVLKADYALEPFKGYIND